MFFPYFNVNYMIFMIPAFILMLLTSWYVKAAYTKWSQVPARSRQTGLEAARRLINSGGLYDVKIEGVSGKMSDHYDPRTKTLRLSQSVAQSASVASLAIAAHELGHAIQDKEDYLPLRFRGALVPMVNIGSTMGWIFIMIGLLLNWMNLAWIGVVAFSAGAFFALVTIPVELNASARAKKLLADSGLIVGRDEQRGVNHVLNAAALTYVAALVTAVLQVLYFISLLTGRRR
ncbi:MAG: zinc metallopeptidase [Anaerolineales bacterium]|nr:zinc metallopeptidase [Anaerolineales bacterium]